MFSNLQDSKTLLFLWKMKVFQTPGFKNIAFPVENEGFPSSRLQKHCFSFGKCRFFELQASKKLMFPC